MEAQAPAQSPFLPGTKVQFALLHAKYEELILKAEKEGDCLICHLAPNAKGYSSVGLGSRNGIKMRAHRLVYIVLHGYTELMVLHTCDNRQCINPNHLYAGTAAQNTADMMERGRHSNGDGTNAEIRKEATARRIKALLGQDLTNVEIAERLYLSQSTVSNYLKEDGIYHDYIID